MSPTKNSTSKENSRLSQDQADKSSRNDVSKKASRPAPLQAHNIDNCSTPSQDEGAQIRELKTLLCETQGRLRTAEARLQDRGDTEQNSPTPRNNVQCSRIAVPSRLSDVTMKDIRANVGYDRKRWSALRACVRDCLRAARLNWDGNWKSQSTTKLGYAFNAVEDDFPELRRFEGQWAVNRIAKDVWDNRKTYIHCADKPSTYIGRRAAQRRAAGSAGTDPQRGASPTPAPSPRNSPAPVPDSPRRSPSPGPSQLRPQPRRRARAPSSSSSDDDDLVNFDDDQHPDDAEEEEEVDKGGKGKKRAKGNGGPRSKRRKH
ncbi:hypothetical protein C8R45DRAFT_1013372 [Mycena sanguinolenta]|nr:hypothetical protein C8R45DRAFT_1026625 [Mycena sanguinolenta]KAJ6472609.1 hypothetical protein C8R45DRAFT_1013372 [Mycena sanguinolenta]